MSYRKLGRNSAARKALFTSILTSFFRYGRIETTEAKGKKSSASSLRTSSRSQSAVTSALVARQSLSWLMKM